MKIIQRDKDDTRQCLMIHGRGVYARQHRDRVAIGSRSLLSNDMNDDLSSLGEPTVQLIRALKSTSPEEVRN